MMLKLSSSNRTTVDLMQIVPPIRLVELSQKFKIALQKNPIVNGYRA